MVSQRTKITPVDLVAGLIEFHSNPKIELRAMTSPDQDDVLSLPVVFTGNSQECSNFALEQGFHWKSDVNYIYNGYYVDTHGNCLLPT